jgi:hypothetical protein
MNSPFETAAHNLVTAGHAPDLDTAITMVAESDPSAYSNYLATLAGKTLVTASVVSPHLFETRAHALVTAGTCATFDEAIEEIARDCPRSYSDYLASLK